MEQAGRIVQVNVSPGGVPKLPVVLAHVRRYGLDGDAHLDDTVHGGPHRAVALFAIEAIRRVAAEGHPIGPGTAGENLTTEGIELATLPVGTRLVIGAQLVLEVSSPDNPCSTIAGSFVDGRFGRIAIVAHPLDSRVYARVIREGPVRPGDTVRVEPPADRSAADLELVARLGHAHRASALAQWEAAGTSGIEARILDDGEIAAVATPPVAGPWLNVALGFDLLPNLVDRALAHFRQHDVDGWVELDPDDPATPAADPTVRSRIRAAETSAVAAAFRAGDAPIPGLEVRRIGADEAGTWARTLIRAGGLSGPVAEAWLALAPGLAATAHQSLWLAELDGRPVGTGSLHVLRKAGVLRAGTVVPEARGRGIQRVLVAARAQAAAEAGADVVGASVEVGGPSDRNLERAGLRVLAARGLYPASVVEAATRG